MSFFSEIKYYYWVTRGKVSSQTDVRTTISLYDTNDCFRGHLHFIPDNVPLPDSTESSIKGVKWCRIYMHLSELHSMVDMLRNEKPIYLYYHDGTNAYIRTGKEPVGEGEMPWY